MGRQCLEIKNEIIKTFLEVIERGWSQLLVPTKSSFGILGKLGNLTDSLYIFILFITTFYFSSVDIVPQRIYSLYFNCSDYSNTFYKYFFHLLLLFIATTQW